MREASVAAYRGTPNYPAKFVAPAAFSGCKKVFRCTGGLVARVTLVAFDECDHLAFVWDLLCNWATESVRTAHPRGHAAAARCRAALESHTALCPLAKHFLETLSNSVSPF